MKNLLLPILLVATILLSATLSTTLNSIQYSNNFLQDTNIIRTENIAEQVHSSIDNSPSASPITFSTVWERSIASTHFTIYYNVTGPNGVSDEYARSINSSLEHAWTTEINDYGFSAPPDSLITVYIMELVGEYGYTAGVYYPQLDEYHVENITLDRNMEMNLHHYVCAHEFFQCIQLSYDNTASWFIQDTETWVIEGTAVWMGSMAYPEYIGDVSYVGYANQYMQNPDRTISELDYDAVLFWIFLYEHHGGLNTIKSIMQQNENLNAIQAANATLNNLGTTFTEVFKEWTIANYLKDSYYSNGELFNSINALLLPNYDGEKLPLSSDVADWGADYFEISSSVVYMPIQFEGLASHNLTKILIEHGLPLVSDLILNSSYIGFFPLMQANNLDKIIVIVRSLGNETSNNRVQYTLTFPTSSYTLEGPYQLSSSTITTTTVGTTGIHLSSPLTLTAANCLSTHTSSPKTTTVVNKSSFQSSSETAIQVLPPPPRASFTYYPPQPYVNEIITFDGSSSTPNGGTIVSFEWHFHDGNITITNNSIITHIYSNIGTYNVILNVTDSEGQWAATEEAVIVYDRWEITFIGLDGYPVTDFAVYDGNLYAGSDNALYVYNGSSWNIIDTPTYVTSLIPYEDKLIVGGKGGLYSFDGTTFNLIFSVPTYIKPLGVYNNTLYAGTVLDKPPTLYYCNGSVEIPDNWHVDTAFSTILNFSGPFGSIDSFAVYDNEMYVSSGGTVYSYNGTHWGIARTYDDVNAYLDMEVYNGKLYLATRDQAWRKPIYQEGSGFSGRVIEYDGENWTAILDHDYWIFSLETYNDKLYAGTANKIFTYNGTDWETSFSSEEGAYYAISMITYDGKIYAGMGNGYIFVDPSPETLKSETVIVPEFAPFIILPLFMIATLLAVIVYRRKRQCE